MKNFTKNLIGAALVIIFAIVFYSKSLGLSDRAARLPKLLIGVIIVLTIFMIIEGYFKDKKPTKVKKENKDKKEELLEEVEDEGEINYKRTFTFALLIGIYIFTIKPLGYFIVTPIYIIGTYIYLKSTIIRNNVLISIGFTLFVYLLFVRFLRLPIPLGFMS